MNHLHDLAHDPEVIARPAWLPEALGIPMIMPEELAMGFESRVAILNGFRDGKEFYGALRKLNPPLFAEPRVKILAAITGMSVKDFVCRHTITPFTSAFRYRSAEMHPHGEDVGMHLQFCTMVLPREKVYVCHQCATEDMAYWGLSYWRRSHQIPGVDWCQKHRVRLYAVDKSALNRFPEHSIRLPIEGSSGEEPDIPEIPARYMEIASAILDLKSPIESRAMQAELRKRASELGLRTAIRGKRRLLSDLAVEKCPEDWLRSLFPEIENKESRKFFSLVDDVCKAGIISRNERIVIALTLVFSSADEAMKTALGSKSPGIRKSKDQIWKYSPAFWKSTEFTELYLRKKGKADDIALELGLSLNWVRHCLEREGLSDLGARKYLAIMGAMREFFQGGSLLEVAERHKIKLQELEKLLRHDLFRVKEIFV